MLEGGEGGGAPHGTASVLMEVLFEKNCKMGGRSPHVSPHYGRP